MDILIDHVGRKMGLVRRLGDIAGDRGLSHSGIHDVSDSYWLDEVHKVLHTTVLPLPVPDVGCFLYVVPHHFLR